MVRMLDDEVLVMRMQTDLWFADEVSVSEDAD